MKKYFKKFSIMFVMLLAVIGLGVIQNGTMANAATVGQQLASPESGWRRYDDSYKDIKYDGSFGDSKIASLYNGSEKVSAHTGDKIKFYAYCNKLRIIASKCNNRYNNNHMEVFIDGKSAGKINMYYSTLLPQTLLFDYKFNDLSTHYIEIKNISTDGRFALLDAIDINSDGNILPWMNESLKLDNSTMKLTEGESQQLTATTAPASVGVKWTSSDESIATVDSTGKVTGVKEGTCTITATTADGLTATCTVNVTKKDESISLNKSTTNLTTGDSETLIATTTPSGVNVKWSSSDTSVATVDSNGKVTAIGAGTATITATTADGSNLSASCTVNVKPNNGGNTGGTTTPTNPTDTNAGTSTGTDGTSTIVNIAHAKGDNTNNPGGGVTILFHGTADTTLSVVKTADVKEVWVGDTFTYTIVVTNTGTKTAKAVVVNDSAPNHIQFMPSEITTTQGTVDSSSTALNILVNVGDIPPLGTVTIKVPVNVVL